MKKDLFISHASEDKDDFVRPLAELLRQYGLDVWYDEFELRIGRSISRSIDKGIANSNFGVIVLSESFFRKNWTEYELKSLNSFEVESGDILLPIWKNVNAKEVRNFSPYLADKFALTTENMSIEQIALALIETVKPDLFSLIHQRLAVKEAMKNAKVEMINPKDLKPGPIRHPKLNENLVSRIRLIRSSLWLCYPHSMKFWMDGFQRDLNIEREIRYWEHISACFLEIITQHNIVEFHFGKREDIYKDLFSLLLDVGHAANEERDPKFKHEFFNQVKEIWSHSIPIYDIDEESPFEKE